MVNGLPILQALAFHLFDGRVVDEQKTANAAAHATDGVDINGDLFASVDYRRHLAAVYTKRAIAAARERAG